jgi:hypothetical protein
MEATNAILKCAATRSVVHYERSWHFVSFEKALEECEKAHQEIHKRLVGHVSPTYGTKIEFKD